MTYRYLKAALLPNSQQSLKTSHVSGAVLKPIFGNSFAVPIALNKLYTKTLQVNVLSVVGQREEIVVSIPLAVWILLQIFIFELKKREPNLKNVFVFSFCFIHKKRVVPKSV